MEEKRLNEEQQPNEKNMTDSSEQEAKYGIKKAANVGKDVARSISRETGKWIKKGIKKLYKAFGWKAIVAILLAIAIILFLALAWHYIKEKFFNDSSAILTKVTVEDAEAGDDEENALPGFGQAKKLVQIEGREIYLDVELFNEKIDNWFSENNIKCEEIGVSKEYTELKEFLEAEIVTLYPDLRERSQIGTEVPEGELQGCVKFKREYEDGSGEYLEYIPYEEYKELLLEIGYDIDTRSFTQVEKMTRDEIEQKYNNIKDKFTLDEDINLIFAKMSYTDIIVEYSDFAEEEEKHASPDMAESNFSYYVDIIKIDYQSKIQKYTMPFELNVAMLMITENPNFGIEVTNLVKDSNIVIGIFDNTTITTTNKNYSFTYDYEKNSIDTFKIKKITPVPGSPNPKIESGFITDKAKDYEQVEAKDYEVQTIVEKNTTVSCKAEIIDTWLFEWKFFYENDAPGVEKTISGDQGIEELPDEEEYVDVPNYHGLTGFPEVPYPFGEANVELFLHQEKLKERKINQIWKTEESREENHYIEDEGRRIGRFAAERFLSLVKIDPATGIFDLYDKLKNRRVPYESLSKDKEYPLDKIISDDDFFYYLLSSNDKTKDFEKIMKTLILLYQGKIDYDPNLFVEYPPEDFNPFPGGGGRYPGGSIKIKLWWAIKDFLTARYPEKSEDEIDITTASALGNISAESGFHPDRVQGDIPYSNVSVEYTKKIDSNPEQEKDNFIYHGPGGGGYGLAQWTFYTRKLKLWSHTIDKQKSIADVDGQIDCLLSELSVSDLDTWTSYTTANGDSLETAMRKAAHWFGDIFEVGEWGEARYTDSLAIYFEMHGTGRPSTEGFIKPFVQERAKVSSPYGRRKDPFTGEWKGHGGIDLVLNPGGDLTIVAAADGVVVESGNTNDGYGNKVVIQHNINGRILYSLYGHMRDTPYVKKGETVYAGTPIGIEGSTGKSTGAHLHYEMREGANSGNNRIDPTPFLPAGCTY